MLLYASQVKAYDLIETRSLANTEADMLTVECVHYTEYGVMFYGTEMWSGHRLTTNPVPLDCIIEVWG